jgi:Flp pilus assembly protein TadD
LVQVTEAIRLKPDYAEALNTRGIICAQLGRLEEAASAFETALRLRPNYGEARKNLNLLREMAEKKAAPRE